jgi:simple sugar transport system ATP-binding protein
MKNPIIEIKNISKSFGKVQALKDVSLTVNRGEIYSILGDNGAGKSTLIKILLGVYPPDKGELLYEGKPVQFSSPAEARAKGIQACYQEIALVGCMSAYRNFFLSTELTRGIWPFRLLDKRRMKKEFQHALNEIDIRLPPERLVSDFSGGERQSIAISRAIYFSVKVLILDEPTSALSIQRAEEVMDVMQKGREKGLTIIFITHNVRQVYKVADKLLILLRGEKVGEFPKSELTEEDVIELMTKGSKSG